MQPTLIFKTSAFSPHSVFMYNRPEGTGNIISVHAMKIQSGSNMTGTDCV
jgi:hypothetical protein